LTISSAGSQAHALTELAAQPLTQAELARRLRLDRSVVSRLADAREQRDWLSRERDPQGSATYRLAPRSNTAPPTERSSRPSATGSTRSSAITATTLSPNRAERHPRPRYTTRLPGVVSSS
jgi:hypothetical protein